MLASPLAAGLANLHALVRKHPTCKWFLPNSRFGGWRLEGTLILCRCSDWRVYQLSPEAHLGNRTNITTQCPLASCAISRLQGRSVVCRALLVSRIIPARHKGPDYGLLGLSPEGRRNVWRLRNFQVPSSAGGPPISFSAAYAPLHPTPVYWLIKARLSSTLKVHYLDTLFSTAASRLFRPRLPSLSSSLARRTFSPLLSLPQLFVCSSTVTSVCSVGGISTIVL